MIEYHEIDFGFNHEINHFLFIFFSYYRAKLLTWPFCFENVLRILVHAVCCFLAGISLDTRFCCWKIIFRVHKETYLCWTFTNRLLNWMKRIQSKTWHVQLIPSAKKLLVPKPSYIFLTIFKFHFRFNINKFAQILLTQARVRGLYRANLVHH